MIEPTPDLAANVVRPATVPGDWTYVLFREDSRLLLWPPAPTPVDRRPGATPAE